MTVRWGLLSTARINGALLHAAAHTGAAEVIAVGSRARARAETYAHLTGIPRAHGSYEALLADPQVDAVYVSVPNALHAHWATRALEAGKHVLCEKPFGRHPDEVSAAFAAAERSERVLMEGFMYRHQPQMRRLEALLGEGAVGDVRAVRASFRAPLERPDDPRWSPALDGGALMDLGCYCVHAARAVLGEPSEVRGTRVLGGTGVDAAFSGELSFAGGATAGIRCAFAEPAAHGFEVEGTKGTVAIADPWHAWAPGLELRRGGRVERLEADGADSHVLQLENMAAAIAGDGQPLLGRADAVAQAAVLDGLLRSADMAGAPVEPAVP